MYTAMKKDAAQGRRWGFYESVNNKRLMQRQVIKRTKG